FAGNDYYAGGAKLKIKWGNSMFGNLADWRNFKGQEELNGRATGYEGNPQLANAGEGATFGDADVLAALSAYKLQSHSPLIDKGEDHPHFLADVVKYDFFGDRALKGAKHDIGADEM